MLEATPSRTPIDRCSKTVRKHSASKLSSAHWLSVGKVQTEQKWSNKKSTRFFPESKSLIYRTLFRKRRNEECPSVRVSSNPIYSVIQERNGRKLGGDFHASRYSKPWDTLQFQVEKATTPRSDATDCGGLRSRTNRELNPVTATSELTVSPSRPGTIKSESSDGASEALNESDEIMIDQSVALMLRRISLQGKTYMGKNSASMRSVEQHLFVGSKTQYNDNSSRTVNNHTHRPKLRP